MSAARPRLSYDAQVADAYAAAREVPRSGLENWRVAIGQHLTRQRGMILLDIGAGTGAFATALQDWFGARVLAIEPAPGMRLRIPRRPGIEILGGRAEALPVRAAGADGAWLSTVIHHFPDLTVAARELRRVLRPGSPVLIRSVFPDRPLALTLARFFPGISRILGTYPTTARVSAAFAAAGFNLVTLQAVSQVTAPDLGTFAQRLRRNADTLLQGLTDEEFADGMNRLQAAAATGTTRPRTAGQDPNARPGLATNCASPVIDVLDLLVFRKQPARPGLPAT